MNKPFLAHWRGNFLTGLAVVLLPEEKVTRLNLSVADGIKYIISLGAITPESTPPTIKQIKP